MKKNALEEITKKLNVHTKLEDLGLDSPRELLAKSSLDLKNLLRIEQSQAEEILRAASDVAYDWRIREKNGHELIVDQQSQIDIPTTLTTGDTTIDQLFKGGIPLGTLTEIVGESSSGKTQLAVQLCISVQKPVSEGGLEGSAVYIHSEGPFPSARLEQMANKLYPNKVDEVKSNIHTFRVKDSESQYRAIAYQLPAFLESQKKQKKKPVRLIVTDSISAVYRGDSTIKRFEKMTEICDIGTRLKKLASQYNLAIVTVNQVSDVFASAKNKNGNNNALSIDIVENWMDFRLINQDPSNNHIGLYIQSLLKKPILGLSWSNSINTRIRLARSPMLDGITTRRVLFVEFSPIASRLGCEIIITEGGIKAL